MPLVEGSVTFSGDIAYCPQVAWIRSGTIRENILFGLEYHEERYADVVEAACLNVDFKQFECVSFTTSIMS
jgi:ABC-type multidrug transport system fused ATPase/permease subunit